MLILAARRAFCSEQFRRFFWLHPVPPSRARTRVSVLQSILRKLRAMVHAGCCHPAQTAPRDLFRCIYPSSLSPVLVTAHAFGVWNRAIVGTRRAIIVDANFIHAPLTVEHFYQSFPAAFSLCIGAALLQHYLAGRVFSSDLA